MKRKFVIFLLSSLPFLGIGCFLENQLMDVGGWDLSACVDGFSTCSELVTDNQEQFFGGLTLIEFIGSNL